MASKPSHKRPARPGSKPAVVAPAERTPLVWSDAQWASWRAAPRIGALLRTRAGAIPLVALKAPLSSAYAEQVDEGATFTVSMFVERMTAKGVVVGEAVDATLSGRYYHAASEWEAWDVALTTLPPAEREPPELF